MLTLRTLLFPLATLLLSPALAGCGSSVEDPGKTGVTGPAFERSDSAAIDDSWPASLTIYAGAHLSEAEVAKNLGLEGATRTLIEMTTDRYKYESAEATAELFFDNGPDGPFQKVSYSRKAPVVPITWSSSDELKKKWEEAAGAAAAFVSRLTRLTPVVDVGGGTDNDYSEALSEGFRFFLMVDGRLIWIDDLEVNVDAQGVYAFTTDEMPSDATPKEEIDARSREEIGTIMAEKSLEPVEVVPGKEPIFYGFDVQETRNLIPVFFAQTLGPEVDLRPLHMNSAVDPFSWP